MLPEYFAHLLYKCMKLHMITMFVSGLFNRTGGICNEYYLYASCLL